MSEDPNPYRRGWRVARALARSDRKDLATYLWSELGAAGDTEKNITEADLARALVDARP